MYCQNCGAPVNAGDVFCSKCGAAIARNDQPDHQTYSQPPQQIITNHVIHEYHHPVSSKSRTATFLTALFLGGLGIHRFYVGKIGTGILWLCTCGVFGIGWLIDVIMAGAGAFRDSYGLPIQNW